MMPHASTETDKPAICDARVDHLDVHAFTIPTDQPESDGTYAWDSTTIIVVELHTAGVIGIGYTYGPVATGYLITEKLQQVVTDQLLADIPWLNDAMWAELRNAGQPGIGSMAISAVDCALWDAKAKLLDVPLSLLLGRVRDSVEIYGSGGFTSYTDEQLSNQLAGWVEAGIDRVKMKVGRDPSTDPHRVQVARRAIGPDVELFVDANGSYSVKQALALSMLFTERFGVTWHEEPRPSADLAGLRQVREGAPDGMEIAAGEYGYMLNDFVDMLGAQSVDCLQADVTRCGGFTGFMKVGRLCEARMMPLSAHCAPQLSAHVMATLPAGRHIEYFHDHVRIESMLFDGVLEPQAGQLVPDLSRPGLGLQLKHADAEHWKTWSSQRT